MVERSIRIKADEAARDLAALNINLEEHIPLGRIHLDIALDTQEVVLRWEEADGADARAYAEETAYNSPFAGEDV